MLPELLAVVSRRPRYFPNVTWSSTSWTHNAFRAVELVFGRAYGIRPEVTSILFQGKTYQYAHSFEASCALAETGVRNTWRSLSEWKFVPVRVWIPILKTPEGIPFPASPYLFAIAFDATSSAAFVNSTSVTWSHTCTGSDLILFAGPYQNNVTDTLTGVTYAAAAMTFVNVAVATVPAQGHQYIYYKAAPATGANNIVATSSLSTAMAGISSSYSGVHQSSPIDSNNSNFTSPTTSISTTVTVVATSWILVIGRSDNGGESNDTAGYSTRLDSTATNTILFDSNALVATGANVVTMGGASGNQWINAVAFKPSGGGVTHLPQFLTLGVG